MENYNELNVRDDEVSVGEWIVTMIILAIPIVNLVMLFVWGFGGNAKPSKKNYAVATLIVMAAMIVVAIFFVLILGSALFSMMN